MKQSTINKYTVLFNKILKSGMSVRQYCIKNNMCYGTITGLIKDLKKKNECKELVDLYGKITVKGNTSNNKSEIDIIRDEYGFISEYHVLVYLKDKKPFKANLSRGDAETLYGLYTYYGGNVTARNVANEFPKFTLAEVKYLFRAFQLTKDSFWAPQHLVEEMTEEELSEYRMNLKERAAFKYADSQQEKDFKRTLNKVVSQNLELQKRIESYDSFNIVIPEKFEAAKLPSYEDVGQGINLYLSDMHLGSYTTSGSLYNENDNYGLEEAKRRITEALKKLITFGNLDFINIVLMGDNVDCCGFTGLTARRDHIMPNNMDAREQGNAYINLMMWLVNTLIDSGITKKISLYSVPCGNHSGDYEFFLNKAIFSAINTIHPEIETTLFTEFYGHFTVGIHDVIVCHGKDHLYMKKGLPLQLNDKTKVMLYEYLNSRNIFGKNIHVVKGDLHSNNLESCERFDYRNVLSLYGGSDYSHMNFSKNSYGISYDFFIGNAMMKGTFENML